MKAQASILFNISSSFSGNTAGKIEPSLNSAYLQHSFYAALARNLYTQEGFELLGRHLAAITRYAYFARQIEVMQQASQLMLALPLSEELKSVAQYYQAICTLKQGKADAACQILNQVIGRASPIYQAQSLLSLGGIYHIRENFEAALPYYLAAARTACNYDFQTFVNAQRMIAVVRSIYGDHQQAIADLERLFPLARAIARFYPTTYYDFLNSYALELGDVGRLTEAQNVSALTLGSPFVAAYPEYAQTRDELAARRTAATPSVVAVPALIVSAQAQAEPEPARARSNISLKFRRFYLLAPRLALPLSRVVIPFVSPSTLLERLVDASLPRGPPALS